MGRGRLKMELIANERARKTTFQKRRKGMMKKAYEFSTLCELDVCMIIYGPKQTDRPPELHTWPENRDEVDRIINKYKASIMRKPAKKTFDLSDLLRDRKTKVHVDIYRARKEMYEAKYPTWDERIESFSENQLEALLNTLDTKLESGNRTLLNKRKQSAECHQHQIHCMGKAAPNKIMSMGGNPNNNIIGESPSQKQPCNYFMQGHVREEDQKPMRSLSNYMVDMNPVSSFDHHHHHHQSSDQMLQLDNSNEYLNSLMVHNSSPMAMWMLMESNYNYSALQFSSGASSSAHSQSLLEGYQSNFNDPVMQSTVDNMNMNMMMLNGNINPPSSSSMSQYYARLMQPTVPYMQQYPMMPAAGVSSHQVQVHASQGKDEQYEDTNQYVVMNNRMV
ncbi:PREDICTED: agamous MADS-box [Prunus dulcis]|uniref:PREDICTED: agamous MADS-box n=1 Tax=Prunus dulcis TaxID=3755 RepID=A0A5E4G0L6_PRUDU|nr:PREDICTED: agamous MADS-box [Prunus dulcis]